MSARRFELDLSDQAQMDIVDIWLYGLEMWGSKQADEYQIRIYNAFDSLCRHPELGMARDDLGEALRGLYVGEHLIVYEIVEYTILVHAIPHQSRDLRAGL
jgi:toxin ParE1/3/4